MSRGSKLIGWSFLKLVSVFAVGCNVDSASSGPPLSVQNSGNDRSIPLGIRWTGAESASSGNTTSSNAQDATTNSNGSTGPGQATGGSSSSGSAGVNGGSIGTGSTSSTSSGNGNSSSPSGNGNSSSSGNGNTSSTSGNGNTSSTSGNGNASQSGGRGGSNSVSNDGSRGGGGTANSTSSSGNGANSDNGANSGNGANNANNGNAGSSTSSGASGGTGGAGSTSSTGSRTSTNCALAGASRVDNPYVGAKGYVNPEWKARADAEPGGERISSTPTGVWMDRIAAIDGSGSSSSMGMRAHLDEALAQNAGYIQFVIYDLPGRDCAALSSNGELGPTDIDRYQHDYIDPIAAIMCDEKYASLRIINIIEIDSLPNLVTNTGSKATATAACDTMKANGNYQKGIQYALSQLHKVPNTYNYIDAGHHGWIGWDDNFNDSATLLAEVAKSADGGADTVQGFITNTANYSALNEPYLTVTDETRPSKWIDFNRYVDETSFAKAFRTKVVSLGLNANIGMLIDTSRNGWGGPSRPTAASSATELNTKIDESRIDRRIHPGNWCNQSGAGLGERPKAVDADGIDAYVWIKPPGESDGASQAVANDQGKGVDGMCDPAYAGNARNGNNMSGALPDSPLSGAWFSGQFQELMENAYPPL